MRALLAVGFFLCCSLTFAAPPGSKAAPAKTTLQRAKPTSPNGRKGGDAHQAKVEEVAAEVEDRGLKAKKEQVVETPEGSKSKRFVDVAGIDESTKKIEEMHQVGRQTKSGQPVAREKKAMDDIEKPRVNARSFTRTTDDRNGKSAQFFPDARRLSAP